MECRSTSSAVAVRYDVRAWRNHVKHTKAVNVPATLLHADFGHLVLAHTSASHKNLR